MMLFVYYKFAPHEFPDIERLLDSLRSEVVRRFPEVRMQVMKRPELDGNGCETWMEIYEISSESLDTLRQTLDDLAYELKLPSKRAVELFVKP